MKNIYFTDDVYNYIERYKNDIIEELKANEEETSEDNIYNYALNNIDADVQDLNYNLKGFNKRIIVIASLGLWNGRKSGYKLFNNLSEAVFNLVEDINELYSDNKNTTLKLKASHHDGDNYFTYYQLNDKGEKIADQYYYLSDAELFQKLKKNKGLKAVNFERDIIR